MMSLNDLNFDPAVLCRSLSRSTSKEKAFEPRTNCICSTHQLPLSQRIQSLRRTLPRQQGCAFILLLGSVTDNGVCPTDLSREPTRHRSLPSCTRQQALPQRPLWSSQALDIGRCQRESRLENLCRFRSEPDSNGATTLCRLGTGSRSRRDFVRIGFNNNRSMPLFVPLGSVPESQICDQAPHADGDSKLNPGIYRCNRRLRARCQSPRCDHSRAWFLHRDGPRVSRLRTFVSHSACSRFLCHPCQRESSIQTPLFAFTRSGERREKRSDHSVDWPQELIVLSIRVASRQLSRRGHRSKIRLSNKQLFGFGSNNRCSLQVSLADRAILQMDQTTSANQKVLRDVGQQCEDPGLDGNLGLRPCGDHQKAYWNKTRPLHNSTGLESDAFRKNAHFKPV